MPEYSPPPSGMDRIMRDPPADQWLRDLQDPLADEMHPGAAGQERMRREYTHAQEMQELTALAMQIAQDVNTSERLFRRMMQLMFPPTSSSVYTVPASMSVERRIGDGVELYVLESLTLMPASATMPSGVRVTIQGEESEPYWLLAAQPSQSPKKTMFREARLIIENQDAVNMAAVQVVWRRLLSTEV